MQLFLTLHGQNVLLPTAHRHLIQSMLYAALERENPVCSSALHNEGCLSNGRHFKLFTFGPLVGSYTISGKLIRFSGVLGLEIRSVDTLFLQMLQRGLRPGTQVRLGKNILTTLDTRLECNPPLCRQIQVRTLSPVVAYITQPDGRTHFFSPEDPEFFQAVTANARRKWHSFRNSESPFLFNLSLANADTLKKQVTLFKSTRINAWFGNFVLTGDPAVLDFLYSTGLGAKNSQGFGMFAPLKPPDGSSLPAV